VPNLVFRSHFDVRMYRNITHDKIHKIIKVGTNLYRQCNLTSSSRQGSYIVGAGLYSVGSLKHPRMDVALLDHPHVEKLFIYLLCFEPASFQLLPVVSHPRTMHSVKSLAPSS